MHTDVFQRHTMFLFIQNISIKLFKKLNTYNALPNNGGEFNSFILHCSLPLHTIIYTNKYYNIKISKMSKINVKKCEVRLPIFIVIKSEGPSLIFIPPLPPPPPHNAGFDASLILQPEMVHQ